MATVCFPLFAPSGRWAAPARGKCPQWPPTAIQNPARHRGLHPALLSMEKGCLLLPFFPVPVLFFPRGCVDGGRTRHRPRYPTFSASLVILHLFPGQGGRLCKEISPLTVPAAESPPQVEPHSPSGREGRPTTALCSAVSTSAHTDRSESCSKGTPSTALTSAANSSTPQSFGKIQGSKRCH